MNKLLALCYVVLSLFGCDAGRSIHVTRSSVDGIDVLHARAVVQGGVARFECLRSASGRCHYTLFPEDCVPADPVTGSADAAAGLCASAPLERFALAGGDRREIPGLRRFRLCVSDDEVLPGPDCAPPEPMAAR